MKKRSLFPIMLIGFTLGLTSCNEDSKKEDITTNPFANLPADSGQKPTTEQMDAAIANFVDNVAIPTYAELVNKMTLLKNAVDKFIASGTKTDLENACDAWRDARKPWEESEAFLFGAADKKSYDPSLDSWPLDKEGIDQILETGNWDAIEGDVNEDESAVNPPQNLRGFHTAEYLLFNEGDARDIADYTNNMKIYLQKVVTRMLSDVTNMHKGWTTGLPGDEDLPTAYGAALKEHNGTYGISSIYVAIETMLNDNNGMAAIANEVGTAKIADPVNAWNSGDKEGGVLAVESWYSWNSLTDYVDNIVSIKNCYLGGRNGEYNEAESLSALVKIINPTLDQLIRQQIEDTMDAINDIPKPFRNNLGASVEIKKAQNACAYLNTGLGLVRGKLASN